jgi:FkbM family methyltransferase
MPNSLLGKILRLPLWLVPPGLALPIRQGPLGGDRWIAGSSVRGRWLGSHELDKQIAIAEVVRPGSVFFDVGAQAGFYTLLASKLVGPSGRVFAFEPLPRNLEFLTRHVHMNRAFDVTIFPTAVSDQCGSVKFRAEPSSHGGRIDPAGELQVEAVTLDELLGRGTIPMPDYLNIDVEASEFAVLQGAKHILTEGTPRIFLATHSPQLHADCLALLKSLGYFCRPLDPKAELATCDEIIASK